MGHASLPTHGSFVINSDDTITYTPDADYNGTDSLVYVVSDGTLTDNALVTVTVTAVADAPRAVDDTARTPAGGSAKIPVLDNDYDPDGDPVSVTGIASAPSHGIASVNARTTITYTPDAGYSGTDSLVYGL